MTRPCSVRRENDELACSKCGKRWFIGEERPTCTHVADFIHALRSELFGRPKETIRTHSDADSDVKKPL
jgi:hypothetical protein